MTTASNSFSCLSYNIHKGFSADNRQFQLAEMRTALRATGADVVALQEILGAHNQHADTHPNWEHQVHLEYLADSVWSSYAYGKNAIYQHGHHGNALLSKYPFLEFENHNITQWRFSQRGLLHGIVHPTEISNTKIHLACVHMGFLPLEQWSQTRKIIKWAQRIPNNEPLVLMGDFNDWHRRIHHTLLRIPSLKEVGQETFGRPLASYPTGKPRLALDRIYYRGLKLDQCKVLSDDVWSELSDHHPVFANFLLES